MKRILLISWFFPPLNAVASGRPASWARYWAEAGHEVVVLTAKKSGFDGQLNFDYPLPKGVQLREVGVNLDCLKSLRGKRKAIGFFNARMQEWSLRHWGKKASALALSLEEEFDVVVSTFGPPQAHLVAKAYKQAHPKTKWIADYRDLWTLLDMNQNRRFSLVPDEERKPEFEKQTLAKADLVVGISQGMTQRLQEFHQKPTAICYNGFEGESLPFRENQAEAVQAASGKLRVVYTGLLYQLNYRNPTALYQAMAQLQQGGELKTVVDYYGPDFAADDHAALIAELGLEGAVEFHGRVSREQSEAKQREAGALLFLGWDDPKEVGMFSAKIFEYLKAGVPILAIGGTHDREVVEAMEKTGQVKFFGKQHVAELAESLRELQQGQFPAWVQPKPEEIQRYHRREQALDLLSKMD